MANNGNTLTINKLTLDKLHPTDNKWGIYFPSNSKIPYFEAQLALPSGDNTNYIGTCGTITLFIRPSITNYNQLESINANLVGKTVSFIGPSFNLDDPRFPGVIVYQKINNIDGIAPLPDINQATVSNAVNTIDPYLYYDYTTNKIVGPVYTNLIQLQNTQTIVDKNGVSYRYGKSDIYTNWFLFNGVDIPLITASFTNSIKYNKYYNKFLLEDPQSSTNTYYVTRSLPYDIAILDTTKFKVTKIDNTVTLIYNGSYKLNYISKNIEPKDVDLSNITYKLASVENYFFFTFETQISPYATEQQIGQCPSQGVDKVGMASVVYYIKSSDLINQCNKSGQTIIDGTANIPITLKLQGTRFCLSDTEIKINAYVTASYSINKLVPSITAIQLTPDYVYTPITSYGLQYKYVLPPSGLLPGGAPIPDIFTNVARFTSSGQKDIFITNFNSLYTNDNNYTGPVANPLSYPNTIALIQDTGSDFPYLFSTWSSVTLTEAPIVDKFGVVIYNYPYGSQYIPLDNTNKNVVYKWKIIQDPDKYNKAKIILTRPDDCNVYNVVLTPTNTNSNGSYYDSYNNLVLNWASKATLDIKTNTRKIYHNYIKGLYIDADTQKMTYDIDTDIIQNKLQFVIVNATDNDIYITSSKIDWNLEDGYHYSYTGSYGYYHGYGYNYDNYYLLYDVVSGLGPIAPHTHGRFVLEAVDPNMWSLATITLDSIGESAPTVDVIQG